MDSWHFAQYFEYITFQLPAKTGFTISFLQMLLLLSRVWLLCDTMGCNPLDFSVHGMFQARILEWVAISFSILQFLRKNFKITGVEEVVNYLANN